MTDLEQIQTPEERELAVKRVELAALETELVERELELSTLQRVLSPPGSASRLPEVTRNSD